MTMTENWGARPSGLEYLEFTPAGISTPASKSIQSLPLPQHIPTLVFLHGSGEHGRDLNLLKHWGLPKLICAGLQVPYRVLCPQCPEGVEWDLEQIAELIENHTPGNQARTFLTGYSKGATAAWKLAARFGHLLAGLIPVAGRWELADAALVAVPVLGIHGTMDERPSPAPMIDAITQWGGDARLWMLEDQGHFISDIVFIDQALYEWIASKSLLSTPQPNH